MSGANEEICLKTEQESEEESTVESAKCKREKQEVLNPNEMENTNEIKPKQTLMDFKTETPIPTPSNDSSAAISSKNLKDPKMKPARRQNRRSNAQEVSYFSDYNKKQIIKGLMDKGCNSKNVDKILSSYNVQKKWALDYLNKQAEEAQTNVHEECDSLSFENIEKWLRFFKESGLDKKCFYEPAIVINAIANNEDLPVPSELNGVDLKAVYKFLGNALLGLPQPGLDEESAKFLTREIEMLIEEANSESGDRKTRLLKRKLDCENKNTTVTKQKLSLDPLLLLDDID